MCNAAVLTSQVVTAMPLSRTRSLLTNINGNNTTTSTPNEVYLPHIPTDSSNHLPQLKLLQPSNNIVQNSSINNSGSSVNFKQPSVSSASVVTVTNGGSGAMQVIQPALIDTTPHHISASSMHPQLQSLPNLNLQMTGTSSVVQQGGQQSGQQQSRPPGSSEVSTLPTSPTTLNKTSSTSSTSSGGGSQKPKTMVATPEQVVKLYMGKLTPFEHHEIFNYQQIFFIGANAKKRPGLIGTVNNCGYDNEQGSYIHIPHDHIAYRYEVLRVIGKGSFGQVVKAYDHKLHQHVALKMVRNEKRFHRQAQEEIRILEHLRKQDKDNSMNIIHMFDNFTFRNHMCITFELLSINLYELIKKNKFQGFSLQLVRKFAHSLLQCLDALYKNKIIHCDMKPENVLLKQQGRSGIKVRYIYFFYSLTILLLYFLNLCHT
jgi:dual specificity tyrosine-phosphorylation-regulated kinase 2/3/4